MIAIVLALIGCVLATVRLTARLAYAKASHPAGGAR